MPQQCRPLPHASDVWEWYSFNPLTGDIHSRRRNLKRPIGSMNACGYLILGRSHHGHQIALHRLVWKWVTGNDPTDTIDHINNDRADNRFWNLKEATDLHQARNRSNVKLNPDKVRQIRARLANGERPGQIHADFGCSRETVVAVQKNRIWKDVA